MTFVETNQRPEADDGTQMALKPGMAREGTKMDIKAGICSRLQSDPPNRCQTGPGWSTATGGDIHIRPDTNLSAWTFPSLQVQSDPFDPVKTM